MHALTNKGKTTAYRLRLILVANQPTCNLYISNENMWATPHKYSLFLSSSTIRVIPVEPALKESCCFGAPKANGLGRELVSGFGLSANEKAGTFCDEPGSSGTPGNVAFEASLVWAAPKPRLPGPLLEPCVPAPNRGAGAEPVCAAGLPNEKELEAVESDIGAAPNWKAVGLGVDATCVSAPKSFFWGSLLDSCATSSFRFSSWLEPNKLGLAEEKVVSEKKVMIIYYILNLQTASFRHLWSHQSSITRHQPIGSSYRDWLPKKSCLPWKETISSYIAGVLSGVSTPGRSGPGNNGGWKAFQFPWSCKASRTAVRLPATVQRRLFLAFNFTANRKMWCKRNILSGRIDSWKPPIWTVTIATTRTSLAITNLVIQPCAWHCRSQLITWLVQRTSITKILEEAHNTKIKKDEITYDRKDN